MSRHIALCAAFAFAAFSALHDGTKRWAATAELPPMLRTVSAEVVDRHKALLRAFPVENGRWRLATRPSQVDPRYIAALIAYEDKRFYRHFGVDPRALIRAAASALWQGKITSGGSTLTMQVARLLENGPTGRWDGKLRQMRVALALEQRFSKPEILSLYLTHAPFGGNLEGVRAASYAYFGKEPKRLTPDEIALLVALPQSPEKRRPDRAPDHAKAARELVVARLHKAGIFSSEAATTALAAPLPLSQRHFPQLAFHETEHQLRIAPSQTHIALTLEAEFQKRLEQLARKELSRLEPRATIAMIVADHHSGEVLASIGSAAPRNDVKRSSFVDMTRAIRSPGSAIKPLVYATAFDLGIAHPETIVNDAPMRFGRYAPSNFDGHYRGELALREALQLSLNIPVIALLEDIGPERFMQRLREAGVRPELAGDTPGLAIALGGLGISLHDLTTLYAGLAQGGRTRLISSLPAQRVQASAAFTTPAAAWHVADILAAAPLVRAPGEHGIAFKTGTSYGYRDNWAVGFDGKHVVGVWVGRPDGTPMQSSYARDTAAPLMAQAFQYLAPKATPLPAPPPDALTVSHEDLPLPLQFLSKTAPNTASDAPKLVFPPDGARLAKLEGAELILKLDGGTPPFAVFTNEKLRATGARSSVISLGPMQRGFFRLSVIDAKGRAAKSEIEIR